MLTHDRTWLPIGLTAVAALFINVAVLSAATLPSAAASDPTPAETSREVAAEQVVQAGYGADGTFELDAISAAGLTARQHLDAAAESAARTQAQRAAERAATEQAAAELRAASHTTEATPAPTPAPADSYQARAERAADAIPFDWRAHGITFQMGCHPDQSRCAWGTFDYHVDQVWLSPAAFASDARLRYVVAHELAHAWQWSTNLDDRKADLTDFGVPTSDGIEYGADCVAEAWGRPVSTYWDCPSDAVVHMRSVFTATI